ncbi:MAG TPA: acyl-CoA dehydrogenase [Acidobacteriaceae bacterium]|jgi:butyryl-CoA dehydrogenase/short/branched chain acyl-CoA dehydrogenase|nr:acyl-CoA dehydrogenase [Acidobacteriaceae bacterium]
MAETETAPETVAPLTTLTEEETMLRDTVRQFAQQEIAPRVRAMDEAQKLDAGILRQMFELGLMAIEAPMELGGAGASFFSAVLAVEEIARVDPAVAVIVDVQNTLAVNALLRWGTAEQKQMWIPRMAQQTVCAYALSEAASGSDAFSLTTQARADGHEYVLNGRKLWISNAMEADLFLVFATLDPQAGYRGITAFVVERGAAGFTVGHKEDKMGIRASSTCELLFDDCRVPSANVIGEVGKGYKIAIETLNEGRIGIAAQMLGLAEGAWSLAAKYSRERKQFGKPIAEFQAVQFALAEMATQIEAVRLLVYNAARMKAAGLPFVKEAAMAKLFASRVAEDVASKAVEVYGGYGFVKDYPVEKFYRDAKIGSIYEGTSNMQLATIGKLVLS